jgi:glycosyltransferase involved in cell wall biosynthesis
MSAPRPQVSIGLPVFNGQRYLALAIDSLLAQTHTDFELVIVDNASTDRTEEICRDYAARDARVRYHRNPENIGPGLNYYRTVDLASAPYFKLAADDDLYEPEFVARCLSVLESIPEAVCVYSRVKVIDEAGQHVSNLDVRLDTHSEKPHVRFYNMIGVDYLCIQLYGVMKLDVLRRVHRYQGYSAWDRNLLAELALLGQIHEIPEHMFLHRLHAKATGAMLHFGRPLEELKAVDPSINWTGELSKPKLYAARRFANYFSAIARAPLSAKERALCCGQLARLGVEKAAARAKR